MVKKLFIDFDNTIFNTIKAVASLYNEDYRSYDGFKPVNWWDIHTWDFKECCLANREDIHRYFKQPRFFDALEYMDYALEVIQELSKKYDITIISKGSKENLREKGNFIMEETILSCMCKFIGVDYNIYEDKSHIDMSGGIFIDDEQKNLETSNADIKICFGERYPWNANFQGIRCHNWIDVIKTITAIEKIEKEMF